MAAEPTNEELVREACRSYDIRIPGAHREQSLDALLRERQHALEPKRSVRPHKPWPGDFGSVSAHSHQNLTGEWELCTENDCEVYA